MLLHDVGKPPTFAPATGPGTRIRFDGHVEVGVRMAENICRALRFSNDDIEQIEALVANHMRFKDVQQMRQATLKRFVRLPRFEEHLELHRLDCLASHGNLDAYDFRAAVPGGNSARRSVSRRGWSPGDDLKEHGNSSRAPDSRKSCWPWRRPSWTGDFGPRKRPPICPVDPRLPSHGQLLDTRYGRYVGLQTCIECGQQSDSSAIRAFNAYDRCLAHAASDVPIERHWCKQWSKAEWQAFGHA